MDSPTKEVMARVVKAPAAIAPNTHQDRGNAGVGLPKNTSGSTGVRFCSVNRVIVPAIASSKIKRNSMV
ncbi:MAG: hypothetical protein DCF22_04255 [Leptolyngbya sp.]|nr:MAG: hypothetical protein DCF22_04255 [Leptolyngbya sp.]